jgi:hypothetical protein
VEAANRNIQARFFGVPMPNEARCLFEIGKLDIVHLHTVFL